MSLKTEIVQKLTQRAEKPENEFWEIINMYKHRITELGEVELSALYTLGRKADILCALIPYPGDELEKLVISGDLGAGSKAAELCDCLNAAESIFIKL